MQGELSAVRQTEGLVSYNNAVVAEHYNPSASHSFGTSPYTGEAIKEIICNPFVSLTLNTSPYTGEAERGGIVRFS